MISRCLSFWNDLESQLIEVKLTCGVQVWSLSIYGSNSK
jgi:hypothetical protein